MSSTDNSTGLSCLFKDNKKRKVAHHANGCDQLPSSARRAYNFKFANGKHLSHIPPGMEIYFGGETPSGAERCECSSYKDAAEMLLSGRVHSNEHGYLEVVGNGVAVHGGRDVPYQLAIASGRFVYMPDEEPVVTVRNTMTMLGEFFTPHVIVGNMVKEFLDDALPPGARGRAADGDLKGTKAVLVLAVRRCFITCTNGTSWRYSYHPNFGSPPCSGGSRADWPGAVGGDEYERAVIGHAFTTGTNYSNPLQRNLDQYISLPISRLIWTDYSKSKRSASTWDYVSVKEMRNWSDWAAYFHCRGAAKKDMMLPLEPVDGTYWSEKAPAGVPERELVGDPDRLLNTLADQYGCRYCPMSCPMKAAIGMPSRGAIAPVAGRRSLAPILGHLHMSYASMGAKLEPGQVSRWMASALSHGNIPQGIKKRQMFSMTPSLADRRATEEEREWLHHGLFDMVEDGATKFPGRSLWSDSTMNVARTTFPTDGWWDEVFDEIVANTIKEERNGKKETERHRVGVPERSREAAVRFIESLPVGSYAVTADGDGFHVEWRQD